MMVKRQNGLICNDRNCFYYSDFAFMLNKVDYEKDEDNGRCYILEYSSCLRPECDGKLVRKRISAAVYNQALEKLKSMMA